MATIVETVKMFACLIARRGKAAKGYVPVETFGEPILDGQVARKWKYDHAPSAHTPTLIEQCKKIAHINEILMRGADTILKSASIKSQGPIALLANRLISLMLVQDAAEAKAFATSWINAIKVAESQHEDNDEIVIPTIEQFIKGRTSKVAKLKAAGQWRERKVEPVEVPDDSDDDE